jgi:hypothetical protein
LWVKTVDTGKLLSIKFDNEKQKTSAVTAGAEEEAAVEQTLASEKKVEDAVVQVLEVIQETVLPALVEMLKKPVVNLVERAGSDSGNSDDCLLVEAQNSLSLKWWHRTFVLPFSK